MNHYGVYVDTNEPTTGVVQNNGIEFLSEELMYGIDVNAEEAFREFRAELAVERGVEDAEEVEDYDRLVQDFLDSYECEMGTILLGSWIKGTDGTYTADASGEYAAIVREDVTQVIHSTRIVLVRAMCSPCYPGQADLDSGDGDILAYALPLDLMGAG